MVKNLPAVERSTKIRFGKNVPDSTDQEENTIVFNASNVHINAEYAGSVYMTPLRVRTDVNDRSITVLTYNRTTKEVMDSGAVAEDILQFDLEDATRNGNTTSNTIQFVNPDISFITSGNVGIANGAPIHTVDIGSNLYIDEFGSNVLVVSGNVAILRDLVVDGNLRVNGDTTVIYTENTAIKDALIELGQNNTSADTTLDLGILMHRPDALSNVVIGYREGTDEFAIGYTDANPTDKTFTPKTDEDINVHVYGLTHVDANIYAHEDILVDGNVYVGGNVVAYKDFTLTGNAYVSGNVSVTEELTISNNVYADKDLEVVGNVYVDGNVVAYKDFTLTGNAYVSGNVSITEELTISNNVYADKDVEILGNTYVSGNVTTYKDLLVSGNAYVSGNVSVTEELTVSGNVYTQKDVEILGNTYVSGNVSTYKDLLVSGNAYVSGNVNVTKQLSVSGNAYISGNVEVTKSLIVSGNTHLEGDNIFITHTMDFLDPATAIVTDLNSNVEVKLNQLANVVIVGEALANEDMLVYDGSNWTNQLQDHTFLYAKAEEAISKGDAVYATGTVGNNTFSIRKAQANLSATMPALGLEYQDFALNDQGLIVTFGRSDGINTDNFITGETVYVSNVTAGALSNVKPYGGTDLIQNIGLVVKGHPSTGIVSVTGVGRSNDIPNAVIETSNASVNYVYVNSVNNDLRKIDPMKLPTKLQPLSHVVNTGNTVANAVTLRGLSITSGDGFDGDLVVAGDVTVDSTTLKVNSTQHNVGIGTASPLSGSNLHVFGETTTISIDKAGSTASPEFSLYRDQTGSNGNYLGQIRFDGKHDGGNNQLFGKITGKIKTATQGAEYGTIETALVTNGSQVISLRHSGDLFQLKNGTDFEVGEVANLYVDTATSRVGINTDTPAYSLDVHGTSNVGTFTAHNATISDSTEATSKSSGALQVVG